MGVILRRTADGFAPYWYGRWTEDGKRHETSLMRWRGVPPGEGETEGDAVFERSRAEAENLFKRIREGEKSREEEVALTRKILHDRYGGKVARLKLADLAAKWDGLPHRAGEKQRERVRSIIERFRRFMAERFPSVSEVGALTADHFQKFLADVEASGVTARTWNDVMCSLRAVLRRVDGNSKGFRDYLANLPKRPVATVHRRPFAGDELDAVLAAAREVDEELHPVLVAAACTALRRGDVCGLRWSDVDLREGFVTVKTSKTGETVDIPIFPPFRAVLEEAERKRKRGVPYVWPGIALAYARNPFGLNWRLQKVLARAGFTKPERTEEGKYEAPEDEEAAAAMLEDGMERAGWTEKRKAKARRILALHFEGKNGKEIAEEIGTSKGAVCDYLHAMEDAGRIALVSPPKRPAPARATVAELKDGERRKRRGSLTGWHAFRTTFCTLALANGVPMEILQRITGHKTAEIVLKHYDRRGREAMKKAFGEAMPRAIAGAVGGAGGVLEGECVEVPAGVPPELAGLLANASAADLEKVARMLKKKGGK